MQRYFNLFEDRQLSLDIFTVVEGARLDAKVLIEYPGIKTFYLQVQRDSLDDRPDIKELPAREAIVEFMLRVSLQQYEGVSIPLKYKSEIQQIIQIMKMMTMHESLVEDSAEASLRIYAIIASIPNEDIPEEDWEDPSFDEEEEYDSNAEETDGEEELDSEEFQSEENNDDSDNNNDSDNQEVIFDSDEELSDIGSELSEESYISDSD